MFRKVIGALAVVALCSQSLLVASATQADINEYGNTLQEEYEERDVTPTSGAEENRPFFTDPESLVSLSDTSEYDKSGKLFVYHNGASVLYSSVPDGMIGKTNVYLNKESAIEYHLYRDGQEVPFEGELTVTEPGSYLVSKGTADSARSILHFTIIGELSAAVTGYQMPQGFRINSVTHDGNLMETDGKYVSFMQEGLYVVDYSNPDIGVTYTLELSTDYTGPSLLLEAVNEKGFASGPVSLEDKDREDEITILLNGKELTMPYNHILTETGTYQLEVKDKAGNVTNYTFIIKPYLNVSAVAVILVFVAILAAFVVFVVRTRKYLRVR